MKATTELEAAAVVAAEVMVDCAIAEEASASSAKVRVFVGAMMIRAEQLVRYVEYRDSHRDGE